MAARWRQVIPEKGVVRVTWHLLQFYTPLKYLQRLQLETSNFVQYLASWSISLVLLDYPSNGRGQGHASAVLAMGLCLSVSVRPSVRSSQVGVLLKQSMGRSRCRYHPRWQNFTCAILFVTLVDVNKCMIDFSNEQLISFLRNTFLNIFAMREIQPISWYL